MTLALWASLQRFLGGRFEFNPTIKTCTPAKPREATHFHPCSLHQGRKLCLVSPPLISFPISLLGHPEGQPGGRAVHHRVQPSRSCVRLHLAAVEDRHRVLLGVQVLPSQAPEGRGLVESLTPIRICVGRFLFTFHFYINIHMHMEQNPKGAEGW